jgi:hypothetical protein
MRLSMLLVSCFLNTWALADKPPPGSIKDGWVVEFTTPDGKFSRMGGYPTRDACEAAIPYGAAAAEWS